MDMCSKTTSFTLIKKYLKYQQEDQNIANYFPETYILPNEYDEYLKAHKANKKSVYISKIDMGSQGYGIDLLTKPSQLKMGTMSANRDIIVQKYLEKPLLVNNKKHDLRIYCLVAKVSPLVVFLNDEGLARFCTEDYEQPTQNNMRNNAVHLSNYSINKSKEGYNMTNELQEINDGSKTTLASYWKALEVQGLDVEQVSFH